MDALTTPQRMSGRVHRPAATLTGRSRQLIGGEVVVKELSWSHAAAQGAILYALGAWELSAAGSSIPPPTLCSSSAARRPGM
ncbi:MAG: hypothetical protein QOF69_781, partial [Solirubrobacteraceae bacterium]|nr:hypothetical protein [Solirubrobacteraceae bacterium]